MVSVWLVRFVAALLFLLLSVLLVIVNFSQKYILFELCQYSNDKYHDLSNGEVSMQARVE